jgi:hypothetical protein
MLNRAEAGAGRWIRALDILAEETIYDRVRRENGGPLFAFSSSLTDRLVVALLGLYGRIAPQLRAAGLRPEEVLWVIVEEVFLPTVMLELRQNWRDGLGNEFELEGCWYLPMSKGGQRLNPLPRVLGFWLRAAGFSSASHVGKVMKRDSGRKNVKGWLGEEPVPEIGSLHGLVDEFAQEVVWTGRPNEWKGRLTLARAMQVLCKRIDVYFGVLHPASSTRLAAMLKAVQAERVAVDEGGILNLDGDVLCRAVVAAPTAARGEVGEGNYCTDSEESELRGSAGDYAGGGGGDDPT